MHYIRKSHMYPQLHIVNAFVWTYCTVLLQSGYVTIIFEHKEACLSPTSKKPDQNASPRASATQGSSPPRYATTSTMHTVLYLLPLYNFFHQWSVFPCFKCLYSASVFWHYTVSCTLCLESLYQLELLLSSTVIKLCKPTKTFAKSFHIVLSFKQLFQQSVVSKLHQISHYSFSSDRSLALAFVTLMPSSAARSTISLRFLLPTACAISAEYVRLCISSISSSFLL